MLAGLPQRRFTSVYDLGSPGGYRLFRLKVSEYLLGLLLPENYDSRLKQA